MQASVHLFFISHLGYEVPEWVVNLHQGGSNKGTLYENYLDDDAVRVARPYIEKVFGDGRLKLAEST